MKKNLYVFVAAGVVVAVGALFVASILTRRTGGGVSGREVGLARHDFVRHDFSVGLPENWKIEAPAGNATLRAFDPVSAETDRVVAQLFVLSETFPQPLTFAQYLNIKLEMHRKEYPSFAPGRAAEMRINGTRAWRLRYSYKVEASSVEAVMYLFYDDSRGFALSCGALAPAFEKLEPTFDRIAQSFSVINPILLTDYVNTGAGFKIKYPRDWTTEEKNRGIAFLAKSRPEGPYDRYAENMKVAIDDLGTERRLEWFVESGLEAARANKTYTLLESEYTTIGGVDAHRIVYTFEADGLTVKSLAYALVRGRYGYLVSFASTADAFGDWRGRFEKIAHTFEFR